MDIMRNEYLFGMKARGGTLYAEEDDDAGDDADAAAGDGSGDAPAHATCEACEPLQKRIRELEAEVRLAASVYSMKNAPAPAGAADRGLGLKLNAIDDDDDDDDDDASVMTGMSTARGGKKKKKKRKKGKGKGGKGKTPSKGRGAPLGTGRRGSGVPLPKSLASGRGSPMSRHNSSDALSTARSEVSDASEGDAGSHADGARHKRSSSNSNSRNASRKASIRASFNTISSGMSDTSEDLDLSSLKGGKNVRRLMRGTVGGDDDLDASEAIATVMQHLRLDPNRVAELARVLESGGVGGQATDRRLQVLTDHAASQTQDSVDELLRTYLDAAKEAVSHPPTTYAFPTFTSPRPRRASLTRRRPRPLLLPYFSHHPDGHVRGGVDEPQAAGGPCGRPGRGARRAVQAPGGRGDPAAAERRPPRLAGGCVRWSGMPLSLPCTPVIAHSFFCYVSTRRHCRAVPSSRSATCCWPSSPTSSRSRARSFSRSKKSANTLRKAPRRCGPSTGPPHRRGGKCS